MYVSILTGSLEPPDDCRSILQIDWSAELHAIRRDDYGVCDEYGTR